MEAGLCTTAISGKSMMVVPLVAFLFLSFFFFWHFYFLGPVTYSEAPRMNVDAMLLDLVMAYFTDMNDPSIKDKLCALQQALGTETGLCMRTHLQIPVRMLRGVEGIRKGWRAFKDKEAGSLHGDVAFFSPSLPLLQLNVYTSDP